MELRCGFKRTDAGVIPEEWEALSIRELEAKKALRLFRGLVISKKDMAREPGDYPVYSSSVHNNGLFGRYGRYMFDEELITWSIDGGGNFFYRPKHRFSVTNVCGYMRVDSSTLDCRFTSYQLQHLHGRQAFDYTLKAHPSVIRGIYVVPLPPLPEQRVIAGALEDVDAVLGALTQLIAKKRDLKQAAMQQLLTGQTRLSGFSGGWRVLSMAENSTLNARIGWQGLTTAEYLPTGEYYLVTGTDFLAGRVNWASCCFVDASRYVQDKKIQLKVRDILLTKDGTIGKVGFVDSLPGPATLNSGVFVIRPRGAAYDPLFFYYILASRVFDDFLVQLQAGSTISHLYQKDFVNFSFLAPDVPEQTAIAAALSGMDAELAALEQRLAKTCLIKQGMMQELLTGRTRIV